MNRSESNHASLTSITDIAAVTYRMAYAVYLGSVVFSFGFFFVGVCQGSAETIFYAIILGVVAAGLRLWLRKHAEEHEDEVVEDVEVAVEREAPATVSCHRKIGELVSLLQEMEKLESARGKGSFDPWALRAVRGEIRNLVEADAKVRNLLGLERF